MFGVICNSIHKCYLVCLVGHASDNVWQMCVVFCRCGDLIVYVYYVHECLYFL